MKIIENNYYEVCFRDVDGLGCYNSAKFTHKEDADIFAMQELGGYGEEGNVNYVSNKIQVFESLEEAGLDKNIIINKVMDKLTLKERELLGLVEKKVKKKCPHEHQYTGSMPDSQVIHYYIKCKDCEEYINQWNKPI